MIHKNIKHFLLSSRFGSGINAVQRRHYAPVAGPPKNPMTGAEQWMLGGGFILTIMILPIWGLFSVPAWAEAHKGAGEPEEPDEPTEPAEPEVTAGKKK